MSKSKLPGTHWTKLRRHYITVTATLLLILQNHVAFNNNPSSFNAGLQLEIATTQWYDPSNDIKERPQDWDELEDNYIIKEEDPAYYADKEGSSRGHFMSKKVNTNVPQCLLCRDKNLNTQIFADNAIVGGTSGKEIKINIHGDERQRISKIRIWADRDSQIMTGVEVIMGYTDYTAYKPIYYSCRRLNGINNELTFQYGERIKDLKIWGDSNCRDPHPSRVELCTNHG